LDPASCDKYLVGIGEIRYPRPERLRIEDIAPVGMNLLRSRSIGRQDRNRAGDLSICGEPARKVWVIGARQRNAALPKPLGPFE